MTATPAKLVASARAVLLDFDGPITPLMPWPQNAQAAGAARQPLLHAGLDLPKLVGETTDHLVVLRYAASLGLDRLAAVEQACIGAEVAAAEVSKPTAGAHEFLAACQRDEKPVVIVSNNSAEAVHRYLSRFQLHGSVRGVVGRQLHRPDLMKPHPSLVGAALDVLGQTASQCVMIGDSTTDIQAAQHFGMPTVGFAKRPTRAPELRSVGADAVTESMKSLVPPNSDPEATE